MAKLFALTIIVIAIASALPIVLHTWDAPADISTHGHLIDEQMTETMIEAGVSFLAAQIILAMVTSRGLGMPKLVPFTAASCTALMTLGCAWPRIAGPHVPT